MSIATIARRLYRLALGRCELVFLQNADDRAELERQNMLPARARVAMVRGSGVDLAHYAPAPLPSGPMSFLFLGRLLYDKGIGEYVEAARAVKAIHPEARFRVVGWLDTNPECVSRADLDGWVASGTIEYLGARDDVRPHLREAHVLVLPSYREGTPRSVLEAMSMGRAVITTDAPGCRDTIVDGESGLLSFRCAMATPSRWQRHSDSVIESALRCSSAWRWRDAYAPRRCTTPVASPRRWLEPWALNVTLEANTAALAGH